MNKDKMSAHPGSPKLCFVLALLLTLSSCSSKKESAAASGSGSGGGTAPASAPVTCEALSGTAWVPNVTGAGIANHDATVDVYKDVYTTTGLLTGLAQSPVGGHLITISGIDMSVDLGTKGSISLVAEVTGFPSALVGSAWPVLVSLTDGTSEFVNFNLADCNPGFYSCPAGVCSEVAACAPLATGSGSAFLGSIPADRRANWEQRQRIGTSDYLSVNSFPTCNWASDGCPFTVGNFLTADGKLRSGVNYTAKFVLLTTNYSSVGDSYSAGLKLTVLRKKDSNAGGAIDLNVVLVGTQNITDSRTAKGKQNLDALFSAVYKHYAVDNAASTDVKLGEINAYEWGCENDGDSYETIDAEDIGQMFQAGSGLVASGSEAKALNIFLVSSIPWSGSGTVLGIAGGIIGAMTNGTTSSGLAFSTFDLLSSFNPSCTPGGACPAGSQEDDFLDMGSTISHEMGHFLGLNHPSESAGGEHDRLPDTPECTNKDGVTGMLSINSCYAAAPCTAACGATPVCLDELLCQYNHIMWYTTKIHSTHGYLDANIFSTNSGGVINYSPYVR